MPEKNERAAEEGTLELEQELQRERREHAMIDEEKLGMDELEEARLKEDIVPLPPSSRRKSDEWDDGD